ncbi:MAG: lipid A deacylase LpxR family protein [Acidobacteriota bacterium]
MKRALLAAVFVMEAVAAQAQNGSNLEPHRLILYEENDIHLFSRVEGRDRHYTQGLKLQLLYPEGEVLPLIDRITRRLQTHWGGCRTSGDGPRCSSGWALGQNMYTPQDISQTALQTDERPYAAWLYGGAVFEMRTPRPEGTNESAIDRVVELDVGMIGPAALGRPIQTRWHDLIDVDPPRGWANQLRNEPGIELHYSRRALRRIAERGCWSVDFMDRRSGALGNIFTFVSAGPTFRAGFNMSEDFAGVIPQVIPAPVPPQPVPPPPPPMASASSSPAVSNNLIEAYVFVGGDGRLVLWNELIEGNCCVHPASHGVRLRRAVAMLDWGAAVRVGPVRLTWRQIRRTREFEGQKKSDIYGALALVYNRRY